MQDRLQEILKRERLTPARFAELVGVQRSSVSHIISGRNRPSLEFLRKIMASFNHISPDWLISGKGPYKRSELRDFREDSDIKTNQETNDGTIKFPTLNNYNNEAETKKREVYMNSSNKNAASSVPTPNLDEKDDAKKETGMNATSDKITPGNTKKVVKTILFYDDQTFEVFYPA